MIALRKMHKRSSSGLPSNINIVEEINRQSLLVRENEKLRLKVKELQDRLLSTAEGGQLLEKLEPIDFSLSRIDKSTSS